MFISRYVLARSHGPSRRVLASDITNASADATRAKRTVDYRDDWCCDTTPVCDSRKPGCRLRTRPSDSRPRKHTVVACRLLACSFVRSCRRSSFLCVSVLDCSEAARPCLGAAVVIAVVVVVIVHIPCEVPTRERSKDARA